MLLIVVHCFFYYEIYPSVNFKSEYFILLKLHYGQTENSLQNYNGDKLWCVKSVVLVLDLCFRQGKTSMKNNKGK